VIDHQYNVNNIASSKNKGTIEQLNTINRELKDLLKEQV
jgi:hypothetical protein